MPDNLRASALSTHAIRLTWSIRLPAAESTEVEVIDGFYIGYRAVAGTGMQSADPPTSYTYKTITNTPLQQLYSKMNLPSSWQQSVGPKYQRASTLIPNVGPSMEYLKMSRLDSGPEGAPGPSASNIHHQYYEHIVDSLTRQTQYQ